MKIYRFTTRALAASFANRTEKPMAIILGDDEKYWVVSLANASRLIKSGYELA